MNETAVVQGDRPVARDDWGDFVTVEEAAGLLRVSQSTLWRWLKAGDLRAYRIGGRRVWLRRSDLAGLVKPATGEAKEGGVMVQGERAHERRLTEAEQQRMLGAAEAARELRARLLDTRGGNLFRPAYEDIDEVRRERSETRG